MASATIATALVCASVTRRDAAHFHILDGFNDRQPQGPAASHHAIADQRAILGAPAAAGNHQ
jgi:hypothetical protein